MSDEETAAANAEITVDAVKATLGDAFEYRDHSGNVHVRFTRLSGMSGKDICEGLLEAATTPESAGYPADVRLSWRNRDGEWVSYPHIWVNKPRPQEVQAAQTATRLDRLEGMIEGLHDAIKAGGPSTPEAPSEGENPL